MTEDCRNGHHSWTEQGHGPCSVCGEPSPPPVLPELECGCLGTCHGGHTINISPGLPCDHPDCPAVLPGVPVAFRTAAHHNLAESAGWHLSDENWPTDRCPAHWRELEVELVGTAAAGTRMSDDQLRQLLADPHADYHHFGITALAAELLAARARITALEGEAREHAQVIEYLHHAHGIEIDREHDDFREWQEQYGA
ncbi:hypothetical protein GV792_04805 [Nocardia cyriacigeorgica]|uniref:hypothetical protein n=1 Tax=Nocardia cyriacigeorgica TaxID=135487 RepID=UPI0013BB9953|nr:hypothetical protein [Nocardia cyriacigeorgica]NEW49363.1 hypothetical protein [Nocardia cyriacigeorgica]